MARYIGPTCKLARREGTDLFLKSPARPLDKKCKLEQKPGQHGAAKKAKNSDYSVQLREKQKVKRIYGLLEKQFRLYFGKAACKKGVTGSILLQFLERRLDNVVYQLGFALSRKQARQFVSHGFVYVNDHRVNVPSYLIKQNDEVSLKFDKKGKDKVKENLEASQSRTVPAWLMGDPEHFKGKVLRLPEREDVGYPVNEQLIVELYSR